MGSLDSRDTEQHHGWEENHSPTRRCRHGDGGCSDAKNRHEPCAVELIGFDDSTNQSEDENRSNGEGCDQFEAEGAATVGLDDPATRSIATPALAHCPHVAPHQINASSVRLLGEANWIHSTNEAGDSLVEFSGIVPIMPVASSALFGGFHVIWATSATSSKPEEPVSAYREVSLYSFVPGNSLPT